MHSDIAINQVIRDKDNSLYRVLWTGQDCLYWIALNPASNIPQGISYQSLESGLQSGQYIYAAYPDFKAPPQKNMKSAEARRERNWKLIQDIVEREPEIYEKKARAEIMHVEAEASGVKINNLYKLMGRYWRAGKIKDALLPDYSSVGKTRDVYSPASKKPGKKGVNGAPGKKLTREDLEIFEKAYEEGYIKGGKTLLQTYQDMLGRYYSVRDSKGKIESLLPPEKLPSRSQFLYWHRRTKSSTEEARRRKATKDYDLENRGGTGRTETHLFGPCALAQIDATIADIYLVRQDDRSAIIGRPTVYFILDAYSHLVTGMHVSLNKPSWEEASLALLNSMEDKVTFCKKFGIEITSEDWPCHHLPNAIIGDRGEMEGYAVEKIINSLGITIQNTPPYRGDLKGIVESHFNVLNYSYATLPGHVGDDFGERCTQDYRLDAVLDINQFMRILILSVLFYNNTHYMKQYPKTIQMHQHGIKPIARDIWNFGLRYLSGAHRVMSMEKLRYELLSHGTGSITRNGILFNQMYYTCDQAESEKWFDKARTEGREQISISYDPRDMAYIYIQYGKQSEPIECHLVEYLGEMVGLSKAEVDAIHRKDSQEAAVYVVTEDTEKAKLDEQIGEIVNAAKVAAKAAPKDKNKKKRIEEIQENCRKETAAQAEAATKRSVDELRGIAESRNIEAETEAEKANGKERNEENGPEACKNVVSLDEEEDEIERMFQDVFEEQQRKISELASQEKSQT